jgi:SAM-dependent methyltransferase
MKLRKKREDSRWERLYESQAVETLPWYYPGLDPDFAAALQRYGIDTGEVLDLCTGPGTQAMALAERGFSVTAMDVAGSAVEKACVKAREEGLDIVFHQDDILVSHLDRTFDLVFDRGCFHLFPRGKRRDYVPAVSRLIKPGGYLLLKCFSHLETRPEGPYRIAPREIEELFSPGYDILAIQHTAFTGHNLKPPPKALFCAMRKR